MTQPRRQPRAGRRPKRQSARSASRKIAKLRSRRGGTISYRQALLTFAPAALPNFPAYLPPSSRIRAETALRKTAAV